MRTREKTTAGTPKTTGVTNTYNKEGGEHGVTDSERSIPTAIVLDFETGGLDCRECACTQIAMHAIRLDTFETMEKYVRYIAPYNRKPELGKPKRKVLRKKTDLFDNEPMAYEEKALTYSAITMRMLYDNGVDINTVAEEVVEFIGRNTLSRGRNDKPFLVGQNIGFDIGFLQQLVEYGGKAKEFAGAVRGHTDFYGNFQPLYIDTITLGQMALCHLDHVNSYKLEILCENLGIDLDDAHDADADVTATAGVAMVCTRRMRSESGDGTLVMGKKQKTREHFKI